MKKIPLSIPIVFPIVFAAALLTACGGDGKGSRSSSSMSANSSSAMNSSSEISSSLSSSSMESSSSSMAASTTMIKLEITVTNLTGGQPLSPTALVIHKPSFNAFTVGAVASEAVERIAEAGDPDLLLSEASADANTFANGKPDAGIPPGNSGMVMLEAMVPDADLTSLRLTALSMLGNTNDGFTGLNSIDISGLAIGNSMVIDTLSYDAGTEKNTESAATVPGPAASGEGFNAERDDAPATIAMHQGAVTKDNGNPDSALTYRNRWDNPVARITITRVAP